MKRLFDIVGASVLLLFSLPVLALAGLAVRLSSGGPIFFGHRRMGMGGRPFRCWKLRTMVADAEAWLERHPGLKALHRANGFKIPPSWDPRITPVGHFLRYTHLDELPQLINVLLGEMSLVGPRPVVEEELAWYGERGAEFLSVRPGIFGEWTARGRNRPGYPERVEVELSYVRRCGFFRDLSILLRNLPVLLAGQSEEEAGRGGVVGGFAKEMGPLMAGENPPVSPSSSVPRDPHRARVAFGGKR